MSKLQCIVTSYQRPKYLKTTLESMRAGAQGSLEICVADGGTDPEELEVLKPLADEWLFFRGNPGGDYLRNVAIQRFVSADRFVLTDDDFVFPNGWDALLSDQYARLNGGEQRWAIVACPTPDIVEKHQQEYSFVRGVNILEVERPQTSGAMFDSAAVHSVGLFPEYGKHGAGGYAIGARVHRVGSHGGYLQEPVLLHLGEHENVEYPAYAQAGLAADSIWYEQAVQDAWKPSA